MLRGGEWGMDPEKITAHYLYVGGANFMLVKSKNLW